MYTLLNKMYTFDDENLTKCTLCFFCVFLQLNISQTYKEY